MSVLAAERQTVALELDALGRLDELGAHAAGRAFSQRKRGSASSAQERRAKRGARRARDA